MCDGIHISFEGTDCLKALFCVTISCWLLVGVFFACVMLHAFVFDAAQPIFQRLSNVGNTPADRGRSHIL